MEVSIVKCSNCKKKYETNEENFDVYFGYKNNQGVPFKTCFKCRSKGKPKTTCERCGLDILPEEKHIHNESVYCRKQALEQHKRNCKVCNKTSICALAWCIHANYQEGVKRFTENPDLNIKQQQHQETMATRLRQVLNENYDSD